MTRPIALVAFAGVLFVTGVQAEMGDNCDIAGYDWLDGKLTQPMGVGWPVPRDEAMAQLAIGDNCDARAYPWLADGDAQGGQPG